MAPFTVHRRRGTPELIVDCQSRFLSALDTRSVIPLVNPGRIANPIRQLHPLFVVDGATFVLATHFIVAVPVDELGRMVASLGHEHDRITAAIDYLLSGV